MNQIPNIEETLETYFPADLRMRAYYYGFKSTGTREVDKILSAVAIAGKAFHSTDQWTDEMYEEGVTAEKLIQYAADTAALHFHHQLQKAREKRDEQWRNAVQYLINNSEGSQDWYSALRACKSIVFSHSEIDQNKK